MSVRYQVLFASSLRGDTVPCIDHETIDMVKTLCGRPVSRAVSVDPDENDLDPGCLACCRVLAKSKERR